MSEWALPFPLCIFPSAREFPVSVREFPVGLAKMSRFATKISRFDSIQGIRPKPPEGELFSMPATASITHQMQKIPGYFPDKRELRRGAGSYRDCIPTGRRMAMPPTRAIVLILWLLDSMQDASSAFNFATSPRWVRWEFHCLPRFHCAQRLPSGLAGGSSHAGATQSRANIYRDRRRTMQIVWRSAIASLRAMPCQS